MRVRTWTAFLVFILLAGAGRPAGGQDRRSEFNITGGVILKEGPALVVGFGYYLLPRFIALDLNLALLAERSRELPLSLNLSLNLPLGKVVPFVTGGGGASLRGTLVKNLGAGLKLRLGRTMGGLVEYRYFWYTPDFAGISVNTVRYHYIGVGLTWY
jgi:hypothetical protein